jgi:hypothetical protein
MEQVIVGGTNLWPDRELDVTDKICGQTVDVIVDGADCQDVIVGGMQWCRCDGMDQTVN